jgi:hypothetical protein
VFCGGKKEVRRRRPYIPVPCANADIQGFGSGQVLQMYKLLIQQYFHFSDNRISTGHFASSQCDEHQT